MSLVRRTSVAAVAVTALVLSLVLTLVASSASGSVAEPQRGAAGLQAQAAKQAPKQASKQASKQAAPSARWVSRITSSGKARSALQLHRPPARLITFRDRVLGGLPVLSYRGAADPTVARYP